MLELVDSFIRFSAIFGYAFAGALIYRDAGHSLSGKLGVATCGLVICYFIAFIPGLYAVVGSALSPFLFLSHFAPVCVWLFCLSMFEDKFELTRLHAAAGILFVGVAFAMHGAVYLETGVLAHGSMFASYLAVSGAGPLSIAAAVFLLLLKLAIVADLCIVAWSGRHEDLVEERRRIRAVFVTVVAGAFLVMVVFESWMLFGGGTTAGASLFCTVQTAIELGIVVYMLWHMTSINGSWLFGDDKKPSSEPLRRTAEEDRHDLGILTQMVIQDALLEQGLSISRLAGAAKMPEHRLRRIINEHLGFRNFADYLNHHRIIAAKCRLAEVDDRHLPILTMAMDLGYGSLGPFNRAFKERAGMTPTEYRKQALADC